MSLYPRYRHPHAIIKRLRNDPFDVFFDPFNDFSLIPSQIMRELQSLPINDSNKTFAPLLAADLIESENDFHIHVDLPGTICTW
jgi:hypothetical protein